MRTAVCKGPEMLGFRSGEEKRKSEGGGNAHCTGQEKRKSGGGGYAHCTEEGAMPRPLRSETTSWCTTLKKHGQMPDNKAKCK